MPLRDYFHPDSPVYQHLCPEQRIRRATEIWVAVGFTMFSVAAVSLAFLVRAIHDHQELFSVFLD